MIQDPIKSLALSSVDEHIYCFITTEECEHTYKRNMGPFCTAKKHLSRNVGEVDFVFVEIVIRVHVVGDENC